MKNLLSFVNFHGIFYKIFPENSIQFNIAFCDDFTEFLRKNRESKFLNFPHCGKYAPQQTSYDYFDLQISWKVGAENPTAFLLSG